MRLPAGLATVAALALCLLAQPARAGRGLPDPVLTQFAAGYGMVAAEVLAADPDPLDPHGRTLGVKCRAVAVCADTVRIHPRLNLKPADTFFLTLDVGYAAPVESAAAAAAPENGAAHDEAVLPRGAKFYLTIRPAPFGTFEHASGADAAIRVTAFDAAESARYAALRAVAALPFDRRWAAALDLATDPRADAGLRTDALTWVSQYSQYGGEREPEYVGVARDRLRAAWRDQHASLSLDLFLVLDYALGDVEGEPFRASPQRQRAWLDRLLAPLAPDEKPGSDALYRRCQRTGDIEQFAAYRPAEIGQRLVDELARPDWPMEFRRELARVLARTYIYADQPDPAWGAALQRHLSRCLNDDAAAPSCFRVLAADIKWYATAQTDDPRRAKRSLVLRPDLRPLILKRAAELKRRPADPAEDQPPTYAANDLEDALKTLENLPVKQK